MPPVAAIGAGLAGAAGGAGAAAGGLAGGLGGLGSAVSGIGSIASSLGGIGGGSSGGATDAYAAQIQQAQLANLARQKISDDYFKKLIDPRKVKRGPNKGELRFGNQKQLLFGERPADVFGNRPVYREVDFVPMLEDDPGLAGVARDVTEGNLANLDRNQALAAGINAFLNEDARERMNLFDPYLSSTLEQTGRNANLASRGILPSADAEQLAGARNRQTALFGTAGTGRSQVARDLGLTQLQLMSQVAPSLAGQTAGITNSFLPASLRADPRESQVSTSQAIGIGAADNQFEATFDRNEQNLRSMLEALPDPQAQGLFNLRNALRSQQFAIDFSLADGFAAPADVPSMMGEGGLTGFGNAAMGIGQGLGALGSIFGGGETVGTPGIFG